MGVLDMVKRDVSQHLGLSMMRVATGLRLDVGLRMIFGLWAALGLCLHDGEEEEEMEMEEVVVGLLMMVVGLVMR